MESLKVCVNVSLDFGTVLPAPRLQLVSRLVKIHGYLETCHPMQAASHKFSEIGNASINHHGYLLNAQAIFVCEEEVLFLWERNVNWARS